MQDQPRRDALGNRAGQRHTRDIELADDDEEPVSYTHLCAKYEGNEHGKALVSAGPQL